MLKKHLFLLRNQVQPKNSENLKNFLKEKRNWLKIKLFPNGVIFRDVQSAWRDMGDIR